MKQVDVSLRASTMSPILEMQLAIPEHPTTVFGVASPEIPPTVERVAGGEQHPSTPPSKAVPAPSMPPSKAALGNILDDNNDPFYRCAAHRLCQPMGDQTSQFLMCINCNQCVHLFCAEFLMEQKPVDDDTSHITAQDFTKEGKSRWKKISADEKDNIVICILCSAKVKAIKVSAEAKKLSKHQSTGSGTILCRMVI